MQNKPNEALSYSIRMVLEKIKQIMSTHFDINADEITLDTSFDELGIDSSELVDLAVSVENEFHTEIPNRILNKFRTVGDIVKFAESV